jgi:hypothetical protein
MQVEVVQMKRLVRVLLLLGLPDLVFFGCSLGGSDSRVAYVGAQLSLLDIADATSYSLEIVAGGRTILPRDSVKPVPGGLKIILQAQVTPPKAPDGTTLQASHIALSSNGKTAFIVYMEQGAGACGGLDVVDVSTPSRPRIVTSQLFPEVDIAAVAYDGTNIYMGGQKVDVSGNDAYVAKIPWQGNKLGTAVEQQLPGYFATGLVANGSYLYVTTGTTSVTKPDAGMYVLNISDLNVAYSDTGHNLDDLRSVAIVNGNPAAFTAQWPTETGASYEPTVRFYADATLTDTPTDLQLTGFIAQAEAKSWMESVGSYLLVACNLSGVAVINCSSTPTYTANIPAPDLNPSIVPPDAQSSNAVSSGSASSKTLYFIANGEAGLWVGDASTLSSGMDSVAGNIRFGSGQSVNYVAGRNSVVIAAAGTGGLMIMELSN